MAIFADGFILPFNVFWAVQRFETVLKRFMNALKGNVHVIGNSSKQILT